MKYTRKNLSDTQLELLVTLDAADLAQVKPGTVARLAKKIKVAGFRQGKVPPAVAEKHLDPNTLGMEMAEDAINTYTVQVLTDEKVQPLDRPQVELTKYVPHQSMEYTAKLEILPTIKLGDYKKLQAQKQTTKVVQKDVDEVLERMRLGMAKKEDVDRAAQNGDEVWIDFKGTDAEGREVAGASGTDYPLVLGSSTFIPGFEEGLVGKKAGEHFELPLTFPKDYHHKPLAGAKITFAVDVKKVKEVVLPQIDDDFAKTAGPFQAAAELKADVKRELTDQKEREAVDKLKDELVEQLVKGSHVPTPEVLIADQVASLERDFTQNLLYRGMTLQQYLEGQQLTPEQWRQKDLREQAIRRVQVGLVLAELSKAEAIEVSREELDQRLREMLQQYGSDAKFRDQIDTPEARRDVANRLITEKTVNRLVELNSKPAK